MELSDWVCSSMVSVSPLQRAQSAVILRLRKGSRFILLRQRSVSYSMISNDWAF